jgi:transcriptional regulator with XRE-family HTH domain
MQTGVKRSRGGLAMLDSPMHPLCMDFPGRLSTLRKEKGLTQQALADKVGVNLSQIHRYESGGSLPTFEVLRSLAIALGASADELLFDETERGPDDELRLLFEAVSRFDDDDKHLARGVLEGLVLKHEAKRWTSQRPLAPQPQRQARPTRTRRRAQ